MKVLVLGTSNSLLKHGWVAGFIDATPGSSIKNLSVGMSPYIQFATYLSNDLSDYDYIIFDSIPNDEVLGRNGELGDDIFYYNLLTRLFSTLSTNAQLVVLGFCWKEYMDRTSKYFQMHKNAAAAVGAAFIDISGILRRMSDEYLVKYDDLYGSHDAHPHEFISYKIGYALGVAIVEGRLADFNRKNVSYQSEFRSLTVEALRWQGERLAKSNSIMSDEFLCLRENDIIEFDEAVCLGMYIDVPSTFCDLEFIDKEDKISICLRFDEDLRRSSYLKLFVAIPNGVRCSGIRAVLSCNQYLSISRYADKAATGECSLAVSSLCFWETGRDEPYINDSNARYGHRLFEVLACALFEKLKNDRIFGSEVHKLRKNSDLIHNIVLSNSLIKAQRSHIATVHDTIIVYDLVQNELIHVSLANLRPKRHVLIDVTLSGTKICFSLSLSGVNIQLGLSENKTIAASHRGNYEFIISPIGSEYFNISNVNLYLTAEANGKVVVNRPEAKNWEKFKFIHIT